MNIEITSWTKQPHKGVSLVNAFLLGLQGQSGASPLELPVEGSDG